MNLCKRCLSKQFVAIFKKDKIFDISGLDVADIFSKATKRSICGGISAKQTCRDNYEKK